MFRKRRPSLSHRTWRWVDVWAYSSMVRAADSLSLRSIAIDYARLRSEQGIFVFVECRAYSSIG